MNFISIPVFSFIPPKYRDLVRESGGKIFGGLLVFFILMGVISGVVWASRVGKLADIVSSECPDFALNNGSFSIEKPFHFDQDGVYLDIDSAIQNVSEDDVRAIREKGSYQSVMILGGNGLAMYSDGRFQEISFDQIKDFSISKSDLMNKLFPIVKIGLVILFFVGAFVSIGIYYLVAVILQYLTSFIANSFFHVELPEKERFNLTVLGKFPPHVLVYIFGLIGFPVGFFINLVLQVGFITLCIYFYKSTQENTEIVDADMYM